MVVGLDSIGDLVQCLDFDFDVCINVQVCSDINGVVVGVS